MKKPALLCSLGLAIALLAPASSAQSGAEARGATETEALTDKARQLYDEGFAALNRSRWAEAHAAFLAAWRIKQHYQIASNLGVAELRLGKHRDAAEHLSWYLREAPAERTAQRQRAEILLKEALAKVAAITITTEPEGAEVKVDGTAVGRTPLALPVFLEPGRHVFGAELDGYKPAQEQIEPAAGHAGGIRLQLVRRDAEAPAAAGVPSAAGPRAAKDAPPAKLPETTAAPPEARSWVPAIALGATSIVALGVGIGMTAASSSARQEADEQREGIRSADGRCIEPPSGSVNRCEAFQRNADDAEIFGTAALVSYVAAGALATAATAYLLWPRRSRTASTGVQVFPTVRADGGALLLVGAW